ncbi:MAG: response regulator [Mucilaginibacter sp.]
MDTIVVQETDHDIREILIMALQMEGFIVFANKHDDESILSLIDKTRPHVVMLDYKLSGAQSIHLCKLIKEKYPHLPVVAFSCNSNIHSVYDQFGFDDYVRKPFDLDLLFRILRKHIPDNSGVRDSISA